MHVVCRRTIVDYHREVIHLYSLQYWAEDTALWKSMGLKWNCSDHGWLLSTKDVCKGMILHLHIRISILYTISGPTDVKKCMKFVCFSFFVLAIDLFFCGLKHCCIELPVVIISISL